jgi:FtsP/CotA-like multicopper oxidase with cupredoxin domain
LVARVDSGGTPAEPFYGYALGEPTGIAARTSLIPGPTLVLKRGEPVAITVVNELPEATAVHWHGIELESYFDGVAGFSGQGKRISPVIAPRDSFVARFTPPRSGTFIYHPHADEVRQQMAGMSGALLVVDDPKAYDASHDIVVLITTPRTRTETPDVVYINGSKSPDGLELRAGETYRVRIINIHTFRPSMIARIVGDADTLTWRAVAKDGMDLPAARAIVKPAVQQMGNGETFDFEFVPPNARELRLTVSTGNGILLATLPLWVR